MNKQPFDPVRAIRGEPVVTRDGREVKFLNYPLTMRVDGIGAVAYTLDGSVLLNTEQNWDLFMAAPEQAEPEPFDLKRAMAGEPIMFRDGMGATFLDYDERREPFVQVAVKNACGYINERSINGYAALRGNGSHDLVMKPKAPKTRRMELWGRPYITSDGKRHELLGQRHGGKHKRHWPDFMKWTGPEYLAHTWDEPIKDQS